MPDVFSAAVEKMTVNPPVDRAPHHDKPNVT